MPEYSLALVVGTHIDVKRITKEEFVPRYNPDTGERMDDRRIEKHFIQAGEFEQVPSPSRFEILNIITKEHLPQLDNLVIFCDEKIIGKIIKRTDFKRLGNEGGFLLPVNLSGHAVLGTQTELKKLNISGDVGVFAILQTI